LATPQRTASSARAVQRRPVRCGRAARAVPFHRASARERTPIVTHACACAGRPVRRRKTLASRDCARLDLETNGARRPPQGRVANSRKRRSFSPTLATFVNSGAPGKRNGRRRFQRSRRRFAPRAQRVRGLRGRRCTPASQVIARRSTSCR